MAVATKKTIRKAKKASTVPFSFSITAKDIIEQKSFGSFEIVLTKKGVLYKNYTGYHVFFTPYTVGPDGKAHETSSYNYLVNLLNTEKAFRGHLDEPFMDGAPATKGEILESEKIICEAVLSHPMTAFIDLDYATEFANKHMEWLKSMTEKLEQAMNTPVKEEGAEAQKENLEHDTKIIAMEQVAEEINKEGK